MKISEILFEIECGLMFRRKRWLEGRYLEYNEEKEALKDHNGETHYLDGEDLLATDWEVIETLRPKEKELLSAMIKLVDFEGKASGITIKENNNGEYTIIIHYNDFMDENCTTFSSSSKWQGNKFYYKFFYYLEKDRYYSLKELGL